jgi:hypothetical protein
MCSVWLYTGADQRHNKINSDTSMRNSGLYESITCIFNFNAEHNIKSGICKKACSYCSLYSMFLKNRIFIFLHLHI